MKKVTIVAIVLVVVGFCAYIIGTFVVTNNLSVGNSSTIINKPINEGNKENTVSPTNAPSEKVGLNTSPTTSISAPVVGNKKSIVSNTASIVDPSGNELSNVLSEQSPVGYNIQEFQAVGELNVAPYELKVYNKPDTKAGFGYLHTNSRVVTITGQYNEWYRISIGKYVGFIEKNKAEINTIVNAGEEFIQCKLIGSVSDVPNPATAYLNVRSSPDEKSNVIFMLSSYGKFIITGAKNNFYKVEVNGEVGYVNSKYVDTINEASLNGDFIIKDSITPAEDKTNSSKSYSNLNGSVDLSVESKKPINVYKEKSKNSSVEFQIANEEEFEGVNADENWIEVNYNGAKGYIYKDTTDSL